MSEYTPTTDEVRAEFIQNKGFRKPTDWDGYKEFDRWLAALIREAKAEALEEFADQMATGFNPQTLNAELRAIKREARARAAEYHEVSET